MRLSGTSRLLITLLLYLDAHSTELDKNSDKVFFRMHERTISKFSRSIAKSAKNKFLMFSYCFFIRHPIIFLTKVNSIILLCMMSSSFQELVIPAVLKIEIWKPVIGFRIEVLFSFLSSHINANVLNSLCTFKLFNSFRASYGGGFDGRRGKNICVNIWDSFIYRQTASTVKAKHSSTCI